MKHKEMEGVPDGFDPDYYLEINVDVAVAGLNPFEHYVQYGRAEGRIFQRPSEDVKLLGGVGGRRVYIYGLHQQGAEAVDQFLKELGSTSLGWLTETGHPSAHSEAAGGALFSKVEGHDHLLRSIPEGSHALGNFTPGAGLQEELSVVCVHGDLKEIVGDKFLEVRGAQSGIRPSTTDKQRDFLQYLSDFGSQCLWLSTDYAKYRSLWIERSRDPVGEFNTPCFIATTDFLNPNLGPVLAAQVARGLGCQISQSKVKPLWSSATVAAKKKTSFGHLSDLDLGNLWTHDVLQKYRDVGLEHIEKMFF